MKVRELITELKKMPQDLDVVNDGEFDIEIVRIVDEERKSRLTYNHITKCNWVVLE